MGRKRRGKRGKTLLTRLEQDIAVLSKHRFDDQAVEETRASLCRAYIVRDELSWPQKKLIHNMARPLRAQAKKVRVARGREKHYVYAISDGAFIKVGYAVNPQKRLSTLQTASPSELRLEGKIECPTKSSAKRLERQIHRAGRKQNQHVRGEWFREEIMKLFDSKR